MAIAPRLEMRQGQSLVMTPQLQQAIKLLQLSALELAEYVEAELEKNPLLERQEPEAPEREEPIEPRADAGDFGDGGADLDVDREALHPDVSGADHGDQGPTIDWSKASSGKSLDDLPSFEESLAEEKTLADHLNAQLSASGAHPKQILIGQVLIDQVDDWGYFRGDLAQIAENLGCAAQEVTRVLELMQGFEPVGVMARNIPECLALQLKDRNRFDPAMQKLVAHLDLLAKGDMARLQAACGVDLEDLQDMIAEIRSLTPKPGATFSGPPVQTAVPDVFVRPSADGGWEVELNSDALPRLLMNQRYFGTASKQARSEKDKAYLTECAASASWLVKSLDQRARTILKVAREIVRQQDGFFAHGVEHLRPLNLKTIAAAIEMHESTVSRVTANKFMSCPRGVFEMKYFFSASIAAVDGGEAHSAEAVRRRIKRLIEQETADEVLSDDRIVEILRAVGVDIARRTVAKYRESLRIPSSVERKRRGKRAL